MHSIANIDYIIIIVYLLGMVGVGIWFARRHATFDDFFLAGRSLTTPLLITTLISTYYGIDVLFGDTIQRQQVADLEDCKVNGFQEPQCAKWLDEMQLQECRENKDVESDECRKYRTWVIADQELEEILKNAQNEE